MNFEQWYKNNSWEEYPPNYGRSAWEACKQEVLKILHKKGNSHWASCGEVYYHENIVEEIEKL